MELTGPWRAALADDDLRRSGIGVDVDDGAWAEVPVPGHWRCTPEFADSDGPLLYRTRFTMAPPADGERRWVVLDGLFYQGDVWLDGAYLGDPEGYFVPHAYDATALSRLGDEHVLAVEVTCAPPSDLRAKRSITGVFQHWDCSDRAWNPGGLWRPVHIHTTGPVRLERARVLCRDAAESRANLRLRGRLDSLDARPVLVQTFVDGRLVDEVSKPLAQGQNELDWNVDVHNPQLWWPWSLGAQPLTHVEVRVLCDGAVSDTRSVRTGLRQVALEEWAFSVNGDRLFAKGANLAPTRMALADATPEELRRDVELGREAGLDLLRVHGHITRSELYDAADELGMLIWQDFPLQWGYARGVRRQAVRQAHEAAYLLGHHPSIAVWCAHNEPDGEQRRRPRPGVTTLLGTQLPSWSRTVLDRWVKRAFERADETRPVIAHSGVAPHLPQLDGTDSHLYFGWHHGEPGDLATFAASWPRMVRFVSEFGAPSVPTSADFMHPERWPNLDWDSLEAHHGLVLADMDERVPPAAFATFAEWQAATQGYQAELLVEQIHTLRRLKYSPTGGFCLFSLADPVPAVSWGVLDHDRVTKSAFSAVADACRQVIVTCDPLPPTCAPGERVSLDVHVVSDLRVPLDGAVVRAAATWKGGDYLWTFGGEVPADACVKAGRLDMLVPDARGELLIDLTLDAGEHTATHRTRSTIAR